MSYDVNDKVDQIKNPFKNPFEKDLNVTMFWLQIIQLHIYPQSSEDTTLKPPVRIANM